MDLDDTSQGKENTMSTLPPGSDAGLPPLPPPPAPAPVVAPQPPKSPGLALFLSLVFPGIGQVYNGQPAKAFTFFFGLVGAIYGTAEVSPFPFAFLIPFVIFYSLIDAYRSATLINARALGGRLYEEEDNSESPLWGAILLGMGLLLLFNNIGWISLRAIERYWPLLLVLVGGFFLYGSFQRRKPASPEPPRSDDRLY
jgi:hypothetical protein